MNRFTMLNIAASMPYKISRKEIEKILDKLDIKQGDKIPPSSYGDANVATIQLMIKRYASLTEYVVDMNLYVADAINRQAQLCCFPAYTGMLAMSFLPQFGAAIDFLRPTNHSELLDISHLKDCLSHYSDYAFEAYFHTMSLLAARHGVYIMAGTMLYICDSGVCHRAFLFDDNGDLVGYQDKISASKVETELGLEPATEIKVFDTPMGRLSMLVGGDEHYFETAYVAGKLGAKIILNPTAIAQEFTPIASSMGLNMRVQENNVYGVQSVLCGDCGLGFALQGASCIFAPNAMIKSKNGILAKTSGRFEPDITCARLDVEKLIAVIDPYAGDTNTSLLKKYNDRLF